MSEVTDKIKTKVKSGNILGWVISALVILIFIMMIIMTVRGCSKDGVKTYDIERIVDKGNGVYTVVIDDGVQHKFSLDDVKIGEKNEVCIDTSGIDEVKYVSITSKMAKSLGLDIKEQDGVIIIKDIPETIEETKQVDNTEKVN